MNSKIALIGALLLATCAAPALAQDEPVLACHITRTVDRQSYPVNSNVELELARGEAARLGDQCVVTGNNGATIAVGRVVEDSGTDLDTAHFGPKAHVSHGR